MMAYIKKEPLFVRSIKLFMIWFSIMTIIILGIQYNSLNQLYQRNKVTLEQLTGDIVKKYPASEIDVLKTVTGEVHKKAYENGKKIFLKYGYYDEKVYQNKIYRKFFNKFYISNVGILLVAGVALFLLLMYILKNIYNGIDKFSVAINGMIEGDFNKIWLGEQEGILAGAVASFEQMARKASKSIEALQREKENIKELITDISHQLKTPIASMKLFYTLLSDGTLEEEEKKYFLEQGQYEVKRLEGLAEGLIKISRLETGLISIKKEEGKLTNTICDAVNSVVLKAMEKEIEISLGDIGEYVIRHDLKWTREAIFNILENAVKYTPQKGRIEISVEEMVSFIRIDISDNGIGIPENEYTQIFKRFYRGKSEFVKGAEGSGIGLYLTRKILEEQGGSITVHSSKELGTNFSVFLQNC